MRDVPLRTVLWLLLESAQAKPDAPLGFTVDQGIITISTAPDVARGGKPASRPATQKSAPARPPPLTRARGAPQFFHGQPARRVSQYACVARAGDGRRSASTILSP